MEDILDSAEVSASVVSVSTDRLLASTLQNKTIRPGAKSRGEGNYRMRIS